MLSRRRFLFSSMVGLGLFGQAAHPVLAKRQAKKAVSVSGPHVISRQSWSPASSADFIGVIDNRNCCLIDESGRLTIVDLAKTDEEGQSTSIIAELNGIGKKILDFCLAPRRAYALVNRAAEASNCQFALATILLSPIDSPQIVSYTPLDIYGDCYCLSSSQDMVCVGGISSSGENLVTLFGPGRGKNAEATRLSVLSLKSVIKAIDYQDRTLVVLHGPENSTLSVVSAINPRELQLKQTINLEQDFSAMARLRDTVILGGSSGKGSSVRVVVLGGKSPRMLETQSIPAVTSLLSMAAQKDRCLLLGETVTGRRVVVPFQLDKNANLIEESVVHFPKEKEQASSTARLALGNGVAYIASGWSGVQMLALSGEGWSPSKKYTIPRLPAAGLATWANFVVVAGSDLKLYDIAKPDKPALVTQTSLPSAVRAVASAGSFVLCLSKDTLSLRKIDALDKVVASMQVPGQQMCFDPLQQNAYLLKQEKDKTVVTQLKVYSDSIVSKASFDLKPGYSRAVAYGGNLLMAGLNDLALYGITEQYEFIGSIHLENLAIRDFTLGVDAIFATAVDQNSHGCLLSLSKDRDQLKPLSNTEIPHDGVALATSGKTIATVGSTSDGKSLVTLIDVSLPEMPKLIKSLPALDSASSVTIKDKLAIVAGRGLEIVSLS